MMFPEQWWINRGHIIGVDVLELRKQCRQAATYQLVSDAIRQAAPTSLLDIGANFGILEMWLRDDGYTGSYAGVDSNPNAVRYATALGNHVLFGNLRHLAYEDHSFDYVVVKDVLEHLESCQPLVEAFRVARNHMLVAVYLPWTDAPTSSLIDADEFYRTTYNETEVIALARECGWQMTGKQMTVEADGNPNAIYFWERL